MVPSRKSHKIHDNGPQRHSPESSSTPSDESPVIVEPPSPRPRTTSERTANPPFSTSAPTRITDLPSRLSGWFSHTFSSSSTDLTLPNVVANSPTTRAKSSALLTAAKHGKGHLDKAMRYLLDSDATPDKCTDPIWLLGVQHPGYEPPPPPVTPLERSSSPSSNRRRSGESKRRGSSSLRSSISSTASHESQTTVTKPNLWPPVFYADFTTRIWLTYRSHFEPIRDQRLADLACGWSPSEPVAESPPARRWHWGGEKGWTSDSGWGCMLRTGQSLLANTLLHVHLSRDWRVPPHNVKTADFATYVQIITWFLDSTSPEAPFSVHRMALAGKELGTDVGQWFGPSIAAGAIKQLVSNYPESGIGVSVGRDNFIFESDVHSASHSGYVPAKKRGQWGDRPVLVLLGIRLGLSSVNPIYYETVKVLFTFPQSVGIAGGRPSSSYYFVGSQADNLFYLDPHHARPSIPHRPITDTPPNTDHTRHRSPTSPTSSIRTGSSTFSYHAPISASPLQNQISTSSASSNASSSSQSNHARRTRVQPTSSSINSSSRASSPGEGDQNGLDPVQLHFVTAYSAAELKTFHCDRIRKMPLSGLDPSMLLGFLCKDEADWIDLRARIADLSKNPKLKPIFSVQDEPPNWPSDLDDDNMGLESIDMDLDDDDEDALDTREKDDDDQFFDASSSRNGSLRNRWSDEDDDEVDPITPGPGAKFEFPTVKSQV